MLNRILAAIAGTVVLVLAVSCGGAAPTEPPVTPVDVSPTVGARPSPSATGIPEVDEVIRATLAGDVDAVLGMVGYTRVGCVIPAQEGSPPGCLGDEAPGTLVDAFPVVACGGMLERAEDVPRIVRNYVQRPPLELHAVFRPSTGTSWNAPDYRAVFVYAEVAGRYGFTFDIKGGRIAGLYPTCATVVDATRYVSEFIIWPPSGPHATAPGHVGESAIAFFVPTPYNTFLVTGSFRRTIDEVGATDPFAWSVPAPLVYDSRERWWRVYWQHGEVFDCAESCSVALT